MSDRAVVGAAVLAVIAAMVAPAVPVAAAMAFLGLAAVTRRPAPVAVAVALLIGARAHQALEGLDRPLPRTVSGIATLVADPEHGLYGTRVEVRLDGRRWTAEVPREQEWVVRPLLTGDHVRLTARPRPFRQVPEAWRRARHLSGRLAVAAIERGPPAPPWYQVANGVHRLLADGSTSFGPERRSLFLGLVLGDDREQSDLERYRFRATGLGHLLAVSGQNVAFLLALARPAMERCGLRTRWALGAFVLVVFVLVTRAEASVLRATAMAAVALTAATLGRVASGVRILSLAVAGLLLVDPLLVHSTGFRLSVCATAGLLFGVRPLARRLRGPRWVVEPLSTTLAAQLGTAPILLVLAGGLPAVATLTNVLAVPAAGLVMMLGLSTGLVAGLASTPVAAVINWPTGLLVGWVDGVARVGSSLPVPLLGPGRLALIAAAVAVVVVGRRRVARASRWLGVAMALTALMPVVPAPGRYGPAPGVEIEVGPCGDRQVTLAGAGDVEDVLVALHRYGVTSADVVVASSADRDTGAAVADQLGAVQQDRGVSGGPCTVTP